VTAFCLFQAICGLEDNSRRSKKSHVATTRDASLFHHRVVNYWNKLPDIVLASSASCFRKRLSVY